MSYSGSADLPLHYGKVPPWLAERMALLGGAIVESVVMEYGRSEVMKRLSDPMWFQALGSVMGMDWHSSGITTSVIGALKKAVNPRSSELGLYICGGRGKHSRETPAELQRIAGKTGLDGDSLVRSSRLVAKVDNTAVQDGFQIYLHSFILSADNEWTIVQQGMNDASGMARRYHWNSNHFKQYTETPHSAVCGINRGLILNLTDTGAFETKNAILQLTREDPGKMLAEARKIILPRHHHVAREDVNMKRLGAVLSVANSLGTDNFEDLLLLEGVGPRTLQSLTLVSEVIHGTPSRFNDPARFSFAHGGKDGHPFPVPIKVYDETIGVLKTAVEKAKLGNTDKRDALKKLHTLATEAEKNFVPNNNFEKLIEEERNNSWKYGGMTVFGKAKRPKNPGQLNLFES